MKTVWTWKFFDALVADENGVSDALKEVNYVLTGSRADKFYEIGGRAALGAPNPAAFVSFSNLREADLVAFVAKSVDVEAIKAQIDAWHDARLKKLPFADSPDAVPFVETTPGPIDPRDAELNALRARIAELEAAPILELSNEPPAEALLEAYPDEDHAALKARILAEFSSLRNALVGHIPMTQEQLARLVALEHPKFQTWLQG
jgi:hypothetical protein